MTNNTLTAAKGFLAAGETCGIKRSGKSDLGIIVCPMGAKAAAVFTTNTIVSAAVTISKSHLKSKEIYAVVVNSGNANACTGKKGLDNAITMCRQTARQIECSPNQVLVGSTGIIGEQMPIDKVTAGILKASAKLSNSAQAGLDFAKAIMTTDTKCKQAIGRIKLDGKEIVIAATSKGAGMIGPNMATTLCFITTDVAISKALLARALQDAIGNSLNKLTVDGHQSTNDTAVILASGLAGNKLIGSQSPQYKKFSASLTEVCDDLAKQMALDSEGATRMFKVAVKGAVSKQEAVKAARAVANYPLVKCAVHGGDPNWGRIICAIGSSGVKLNQDKLSCKLDNLIVFKNGTPQKFDAQKASKIVSQIEHTITIDLGAGKFSDFCYGCDLGKDYVTINADYHT